MIEAGSFAKPLVEEKGLTGIREHGGIIDSDL
jgi:hypothetical protein